MGDRGQVYIEDEKVYLYTHWEAKKLPKIVGNALARKQRWDDPEYLARIIFNEMTKNDIKGELGFGIGTIKHEDIWRLITVNCENQIVRVDDNNKLGQENTFQKFVTHWAINKLVEK